MNAITVRTFTLVAVSLAGVAHLALRRMAEAESQPAPNLVHEASSDRVLLRTKAKHCLADDVIARRRTLWEAAAMFREMNNSSQEAPAGRLPDYAPYPMTFEPRTKEERVVLQVIHFVAARLFADNQRRLEEIRRLEKILLDELERSGVVSLPMVSEP